MVERVNLYVIYIFRHIKDNNVKNENSIFKKGIVVSSSKVLVFVSSLGGKVESGRLKLIHRTTDNDTCHSR